MPTRFIFCRWKMGDEGAFHLKLWPWLIQFSLLIHVLLSVVIPQQITPNMPLKPPGFCPHTNKSPPFGAPDSCHYGLPVSKWLNTTSSLPIQRIHDFQDVVNELTFYWTPLDHCGRKGQILNGRWPSGPALINCHSLNGFISIWVWSFLA